MAGTCRRCLGPASGELVAEVEELYQEHPTSEDAFTFDGEQLDLGPMVRSSLMELPQRRSAGRTAPASARAGPTATPPATAVPTSWIRGGPVSSRPGPARGRVLNGRAAGGWSLMHPIAR